MTSDLHWCSSSGAQFEIEDFAAELAGELFAIAAAEGGCAEGDDRAGLAAGEEMRELAESAGLCGKSGVEWSWSPSAR